MAPCETPEAVKTQNSVMNEIWGMLKGQWSIARHDYTDVALNGQNIPKDDITIPSEGLCKMTPRSSTDPRYDGEVLKASVVHYRTRAGEFEGELIGSQGEKYAFRRKNGIWSLWDVGGPHNPTCSKVTEFRLKEFREEWIGQHKTYEVVLDASPWSDDFGRNFFQMAFVKGKTLVWELRCRFDDHMTSTVRQWIDTCTLVETPRNDVEKKGG